MNTPVVLGGGTPAPAPAPAPGSHDLGEYVRRFAGSALIVQPRMGMSDPGVMAAGLRAVAGTRARTVATLTIDSYTRVGDEAGARAALARHGLLNGYPITVHGPELTAALAGEAGDRPVQVRHGSASPGAIFRTLVRAGLSASEGGPVSYCLPYGRTPLAESVAHWREATRQLADECAALGRRAHLETFGGCLLGQLCPPSLLIAVSLLESLFFVQQGIRSVSLSYAQQTDPVQDLEALAALRRLADTYLPEHVDRHLVLYTYMGVFPATRAGAELLTDRSAELAARAGVERLIVKTPAEAHRIPTVSENVRSLRRASDAAARARTAHDLPWAHQTDYSGVLAEATALIEAVLQLSDDVGSALLQAFRRGLLDVPFCLHRDNRAATRSAIDADGRLVWADQGALPLPRRARTGGRGVTAAQLLTMLRHTAEQYDSLGAAGGPQGALPGPAQNALPTAS
ncbi:methylaspartate mutase [Streptomyces sp. NPDC003035]|uniref:methylaspartate mutase n=1 Tax=Streptomyces sp. NPDC003035 TaxID=3364676 RepID=UPI00368CDB3B